MDKAQVRKASLFYFVFVMYSYTTAAHSGSKAWWRRRARAWPSSTIWSCRFSGVSRCRWSPPS